MEELIAKTKISIRFNKENKIRIQGHYPTDEELIHDMATSFDETQSIDIVFEELPIEILPEIN